MSGPEAASHVLIEAPNAGVSPPAAAAAGWTWAVGRSDFEACADLWRRLEPSATPFQSFEWARAWLDHYAPDAEPWLLFQDGPAPVLLPLVLRRRGALRVMSLLGEGPSDYLGPMTGAPSRDIGHALQAQISERRRSFDLLQLRGWIAEAAVDEGFSSATTGALSRIYEPCPIVHTTGTWDDFLKSRTKKFRANLKRTARLAEAAGELAVAREAASPALFDEMIAVERESWKWEGGFAFLRDERMRAFLRAVLLETQVPREVWTVRVEGELAAFAVFFLGADVRYYYLPSFRARYPDLGSHLLRLVVEDSFAGPFVEFDFLQGDERYKKPWTTGQREVREIAAPGRMPLGALAVRGLEWRWRLARSERAKAWRKQVLVAIKRLRGGD